MIKKCLFRKFFNKFNLIAASINLKPVEFDLTGKKCLCLVPHPDDESIAMGGLLSLLGENFDVILLTDGRKGIKDKIPQEVIQIRTEEFKNAMTLAKAHQYKFLQAEDKQLLFSLDKQLNNFKKLVSQDFLQYDYIFVPNIIDQHPDHKAASLLLRDLIESDITYKPDLKICFYEVWSALGFVNAFVDITDVIENKKAMIECYPSQTSQKDYIHHSIGLNQYRGMLKDKKFSEAFYVMNIDEFKKICGLYG